MSKLKDEIFGLVCSGGGALGAYQVGVLKYLVEEVIQDHSSPFKVNSGISCGSINTTFMGTNALNIKESFPRLEKSWREFHIPSYQLNLLKLSKSIARNLYKKEWAIFDPTPMREMLKSVFDKEKLNQSIKEGYTQGISCAATELYSGVPIWFQDGENALDWTRSHATAMKVDLQVEHVISSCSIPFLFPVQKINGHKYLDGGINIERPMASALSMRANKIFSIALSSNEFTQKVSAPFNASKFPEFIDVASLMLKVFLKDRVFSEGEQIDALNRMYSQAFPNANEKNESVVGNAIFDKDFQFKNYNPTEIFQIAPHKNLNEVFEEFCKQNPKHKLSRPELMFHSEFIAMLIDQGYEDAKAQKEDIKSFFYE